MPSLQTALPPELANNTIRLYRECLRRAKYIGQKEDLVHVFFGYYDYTFLTHGTATCIPTAGNCEAISRSGDLVIDVPFETNSMPKYNTELVIDMVRQQFKRHMHETDPDKIQKLKDDAARGLINHMLYESENLGGPKFSKRTS